MFEEVKGWDGLAMIANNPLIQLRQRLYERFLLDCLAAGVMPTLTLWKTYQVDILGDLRRALPLESLN